MDAYSQSSIAKWMILKLSSRGAILGFVLAVSLQFSSNACSNPPTAPPSDAAILDLTIPEVSYTWDPQDGDKSVPPELGGPGFTGDGWQTRIRFLAQGSAEAVAGGAVTLRGVDWPPTLRLVGQNSNNAMARILRDLCYQSLITLHSATLEPIPVIATHWWISPDRSCLRFRINPAARWHDGSEITADDYVATWRLRVNKDILDPAALSYEKLTATALSKYLIEIRLQQPDWRAFLLAGELAILPAKIIAELSGAEYLERFQFLPHLGSGPYELRADDVKSGESLTLRRVPNWWGAKNPAWTGLFNFDSYKIRFIRDDMAANELVKRGDIDYFFPSKAKWFAEELPAHESIQRGLIVRRRICNDAPVGIAGLAFNMGRPPLDDVRVRQALAHLLDRRTFIEKLFNNEYERLSSYWQGGLYANPANQPVEYSEARADELLRGAGWTELNSNGVRVRDGHELKFVLTYRSKTSEPWLTLYQEACKKLGVRLDLQLLVPAVVLKNIQEKNYDIAEFMWQPSLLPTPETAWHSSIAAQTSNNVTAFRHPEVDKLCDEYNAEHDPVRRAALVRQIDGIIYPLHPWALTWFVSAQRIVHTNRFSMPKWGGFRLGTFEHLHHAWWIDPTKDQDFRAALADTNRRLPIPVYEIRFWPAWNRARAPQAKTDR
ncbi:MAG: ABC transporter substrate-binding protein [Planctomycetota bacterium]